MQTIKGFLYWLVTESWLAWFVGFALARRPFDKYGPISLPPGASPYIVSGLVFEAYEYSERYLIRKWLPRDYGVVELGASIGVISREILHRINTAQQLTAVEADPLLAELARENIGRRFDRSRWRVLPTAIAYGGKEALFVKGREHIAGKTGFGQETNGKEFFKVSARTFSSVLSEIGLQDYSLVMDIEGAEYELIANDEEVLAQCQCVIAELHGDQMHKDAFCRVLTDIGMRMVEQKHSVVAFLRV